MKKSLVTVMIAALVTMVPATPSLADLPDAYTSNNPDDLYTIDVDSLTEDELRTAYSTLRDTYAACFQALIDEHAKNNASVIVTPTPTPEPMVTSFWEVNHYVDEFGMETDKGYITTKDFIEGTFSNTATTNTLLYVFPLFDEGIAFKLFEYGDNLVKSSGTHDYTITVLDQNKEKISMSGKLYGGGDRVRLDDEYVKKFYEILCNGGTISIHMKDDYASTYLFTFDDCSGFENLYNQTFGEVPKDYPPKTEIEVAMNSSIYVDEIGNPQLTIETNLPDHTIIGGCISESEYMMYHYGPMTDYGEVIDGTCIINFTLKKVTKLGSYTVRLKLDPDKQPIEIQKEIGSGFEGLKGKIAENLVGEKGQAFTFTFE